MDICGVKCAKARQLRGRPTNKGLAATIDMATKAEPRSGLAEHDMEQQSCGQRNRRQKLFIKTKRPIPRAGAIRVATSIMKNDLVAITLYPAAHAAFTDALSNRPLDIPLQILARDTKFRSRLLGFVAEMTPIYPA